MPEPDINELIRIHNEGRHARDIGKRRRDNPYSASTNYERYKAWLEGYEEKAEEEKR